MKQWFQFNNLWGVLLCVGMVFAQKDTISPNEGALAWQEGMSHLVTGQKQVNLGEKGVIQIPQGYGFIPAKETNRIQKSMGNPSGEQVLGMVIGLDSTDSRWFVTLEFEESGHVKDDDQSELKADEILKSISEGQEEDNKRRKTEGFSELDILGWVEAPAYNSSLHQLLWSLELADKGSKGSNVNYNVKCLGRTGMITMTFVGDKSDIQRKKDFAKALAAGIAFNNGLKYADFDEKTDKVAEYGLLGLIGGGLILKKLGLFAIIAAFAAKFFKLILLGFVFFGAWFRKFFKRKKEAEYEVINTSEVEDVPEKPSEPKPISLEKK